VAHNSQSSAASRHLAAVPASALWALSAASLLATAALRAPRPRHLPLVPPSLHLHATSPRPPATEELISVLLPVCRDTETACAAIRAALTQRSVADIDVVVLDEGCPQEARDELRRLFGDDPRVRVFGAAPLPFGWSRHAHRAHQLAVAARGKVLLFGEPAAPLGPYAAAAATALLRRESLDLVLLDSGRSVRDGDTAGGSVAQTLIGPLLRPLAEHPGRFAMAVDCEVYWRAGGYRADAANPDPLSLVRIVRRATGRVAVADSRRVIPPVRCCSGGTDPGRPGPIVPVGSADPAGAADPSICHETDATGVTGTDGAPHTLGRSMAALWERSLSLARGWPG
jgi:hypothetical protein